MAQITAYARQSIVTDSDITLTNGAYLIDTDESTAASFTIKSNGTGDFMVGKFDFSAIPVGSVINSIAMKAYVTTDTYATVYIVACRKYTNGSYVSQGTDYSETFVGSNKSGEFTFTSRIGTWTRDELAMQQTDDVRNGPWFYVRIKNSLASARTSSIRYFKIVVDYTVPSYTLTVTAGTGGTVTGGGTYASGTSVTLKATPNTGYKFVKWSDGNTSATRTVTVSGNATYTAQFEPSSHTVTFRNQDGTLVKSYQVNHGSTLGTLPAVSRSGYTFAGWIPCAPAKRTDDTVLDSMQYSGSTFNALNRQYLYTNNLSIHIEAYMSDWMDIGASKRQIMSCTEGGGWGLGYQANTTGHGFEIHTGSYSGIDLGFGTEGVFTNNTWNTFDIVFSNGTVEAYVNGVKKGTITTPNSTISYHASNTIFVGAEATSNATSPGGNYFKGFISNVFIANQGTRLTIATSSTTVNKDVEYYPVWRLNTTRTIATSANPSEGGTVSGGGTYEYESTATLTATPNTYYEFVQWSDGDVNRTRTITVTGNVTYTAQFKLNKIYVGTQQPKEIYVGTTPVKAIYVGTTKVYG